MDKVNYWSRELDYYQRRLTNAKVDPRAPWAYREYLWNHVCRATDDLLDAMLAAGL